MEKKGYRPHTVISAVSSLKSIARRCNLLDTESVKQYLASANLSGSRKEALVHHLIRFYQFHGISFDRPRYLRVAKLPFIPLTTEVDQLIGGVTKRYACFLSLIKETGARAGEAWNLKWTDIDFEKSTVSITPEKNSNSRQLNISNRLIALLNSLHKTGEFIFRKPEADETRSLNYFRRIFDRQKKIIAIKLQNPRIEQISFKTLRHYKATMFYHYTKDILATMQMLGHKNIRNTLVYTHLVDWQSNDYVCKVAKTIEETQSLIEDGFEYVTDFTGSKLFRKRK
jgi:integrase